jgi:hypothetical protein
MSFMFEVYYRSPADPCKETCLSKQIERFGGRLSFCEVASKDGPPSVCLTYEFDDRTRAETAAQSLRELGEHVEGPVDYGP